MPLFQNVSKCEPFHMKMSSACSFIFMQIKVIFVSTAHMQVKTKTEKKFVNLSICNR